MKRLFALVFVLLSILMLPQSILAAEAPAETIISEQGQYIIAMPCSPEAEESKIDTVAGPIIQYMQICNTASGIYAVSYADYPLELVLADPNAVLDSVRDGMVGSMGGELVSEQYILVSGNPAREIVFNVPALSTSFRVQIVIAGARLYQVMVVGSYDLVTSEASTRYLESFQLIVK